MHVYAAPSSVMCLGPTMIAELLKRTLVATTLSAALCFGAPSVYADAVSSADLRAVSNALGFLEGLPRGGPLTVGIVYASDSAEEQKQAAETAAALQAIPAPNQ